LIIATATGSGLGGALAFGSWGPRTVLEHVIAVVRDAGVDDITVVLGPCADDVLDRIDLGDLTVVIDYDWEEDDTSGLRAGFDTLWRSAELSTALVVDLERPDIESDSIVATVRAHATATTPVTMPKYRFIRGGPVAVERELWPRLMGLEGNVELAGFLEAHPALVTEVWIDRVQSVRVATAEDLETASRQH
jgi:CTP:molybdopterin cytidylyltransferase MocA